MNVWIAEAVCPHHSIAGVYRSLGAAVRAAKRAEPGTEWQRIDHVGCGIFGSDGYALSGQRKVPWPYRGAEYVFYRFMRRKIQSSKPQKDADGN